MIIASLEELMKQAEYKQHPFGKVWQPFDNKAFQELAGDIDRRGLDKEITVYQGMILEGWHRYLACLATKVKPRFVEFNGSDLEAAELVHASGVRRHSTADQRYASFLLLCEACPAFQEKYEQLREKGEQQQQAGVPLGTGGQRVDVVETKAKAAGVSKATAKKVERVKKEKPEVVAAIAAGKTTANKEVKKLPKKAKQAKKTPSPTGTSEFTIGDTIYQVIHTLCLSKLEVTIYGHEVKSVAKKAYVSTRGKQVNKKEAVTLDHARIARTKLIEDWIVALEEELKEQRASLTKEPKITSQK